MAEKLTDEQLNDQNLAHLPGQGPSPVNTRVTPTLRESVMYGELAAGAAPFDPNPPERFQPMTNSWDQSHHPAGQPPVIETFVQHQPMDLPSGNPSGCRVTPVGCGSDTNGR